jgi:hypothetical protein
MHNFALQFYSFLLIDWHISKVLTKYAITRLLLLKRVFSNRKRGIEIAVFNSYWC